MEEFPDSSWLFELCSGSSSLEYSVGIVGVILCLLFSQVLPMLSRFDGGICDAAGVVKENFCETHCEGEVRKLDRATFCGVNLGWLIRRVFAPVAFGRILAGIGAHLNFVLLLALLKMIALRSSGIRV